MTNNIKLCLASCSKQREQLLAQICVIPDNIITTNVDETFLPKEKPHNYVTRIAQTKALVTKELYDEFNNSIILTADTIVACGRRILTKTKDISKATTTLELLSGRRHKVYTSVVIYYQQKWYQKLAISTVVFKRLMKSEITDYLQLNEWPGKSGCYAIQGYAGKWVKFLSGSYSNVVGLPLFEVSQMLNSIGYFNTTTLLHE